MKFMNGDECILCGSTTGVVDGLRSDCRNKPYDEEEEDNGKME